MKKLLTGIGLTLLLTACGGDKTPNAGFTTLTGTLVEAAPDASDTNLTTKAWAGGAGTVQLVSTRSKGSDVVLSSGTVQANGAFAVDLKAPTGDLSAVSEASGQLDSLANTFITTLVGGDIRPALNCTGAPAVSDVAARTAFGGLKVDTNRDGYAFPLTVTGSETQTSGSYTIRLGLLMYADRPVNITGQEVCTASAPEGSISYTTSYNVRLGQGWNKLAVSSAIAVQDGTPASITITNGADSGAFPSDNWVFQPQGTGFAQSLSLKSLKLPALR